MILAGPDCIDPHTIAVRFNDNIIGHLRRPPSGLWRNAYFRSNSGAEFLDLISFISYAESAFGCFPIIQIEIHKGYTAIYGPDGTPYSRVISAGQVHMLRIFPHHHSQSFPTLDEALEAGRYRA